MILNSDILLGFADIVTMDTATNHPLAPGLYSYAGHVPRVGLEVFLAPGCRIIGEVDLACGVSVWFNAVIRGDINRVSIGADSNIQDNAVLHVRSRRDESGEGSLILGSEVVVGHGAVVHGCSIGNRVLIGMNATILDGATIGDGVIIAAGAVVTSGMVVPSGSLVAGIPGRVVRGLTQAEEEGIARSAQSYRQYAREMCSAMKETNA
jgi:carbonic anhydrase/acetyltransferase-like protein (isoleucine patch superfamily)